MIGITELFVVLSVLAMQSHASQSSLTNFINIVDQSVASYTTELSPVSVVIKKSAEVALLAVAALVDGVTNTCITDLEDRIKAVPDIVLAEIDSCQRPTVEELAVISAIALDKIKCIVSNVADLVHEEFPRSRHGCKDRLASVLETVTDFPCDLLKNVTDILTGLDAALVAVLGCGTQGYSRADNLLFELVGKVNTCL